MQPFDPATSSIESQASQWLARRDRGLSAVEQDAYAQWLRESPAHGVEIARLENVWSQLDALRERRPAHGLRPDPDLLAAPRRLPKWFWHSTLAAAAAIAVAATLWRGTFRPGASSESALVVAAPETRTLEDGSLIELNVGAKVTVDFQPDARYVRLLQGEAHFVVAKDSARPFVVSIGDVSVRAVGTAFAVQRAAKAISVIVTEGNVALNQNSIDAARARELAVVTAGQAATIRTSDDFSARPSVELRNVSQAEMERALAWQKLRLDFVATPLREVVAKLNRYNNRQLIIADAATGDIMVGGSFRADNVESFVRLMEIGFDIHAEPRGGDIVLEKK